MFQGCSQNNNPQAKVLTTVPRTAWYQGVVSFMTSPGNKVAFWSIQTFPLHLGLCRGEPYTSLAESGDNMEKNNFNTSMCEELFGGMLEITVVPDCFRKSDARRYKNCLYGTLQIVMKRISTFEEMVQKMDEFCRIKKTCSCQLERVLWRCVTN